MLTDGPSSPPSTSPTPRSARSQTLSSGHHSALSPLNPASSATGTFPIPRSRPGSRGSQYLTNRFASDHSANTASYYNTSDSAYPSFAAPSPTGLGGSGTRASMVLYRLADDIVSPGGNRDSVRDSTLLPPERKFARDSVWSSSGDSFVSISSDRDSKYPSDLMSPFPTTPRGLVPYAYDPASDELEPPDEEDMLHDPDDKAWISGGGKRHPGLKRAFPWRGILNVAVLIILILALLCLFIFYPVLTFYQNSARNLKIDGNIRINATGQAPVLFQMPDMIDKDTPETAKSRTGFDGHEYELVFSDEFNADGRSFYPGDDPFWEAVDLWYGVTGDIEWYDPSQVTTRNGNLVITMDSIETTVPGQTVGSTAPFTAAENHALNYKSGMLQSWNKFCYTSGYIEVSVVLPGANENAQGYWPGAWTMGNLGRPGYPGSTDGTWPYTYNTCDLGTFPNQTLKDGSGPAAALHSDASREKYNFELSWLSGQRLSACTCPGEDHPGPSHDRGRGAPEIDIFEASKDKQNPTGSTVSQSAQYAPFSHDYLFLNSSADEWELLNPVITRPNGFRGSPVQQSVSGVSKLPSDMFQGSGQRSTTLGFEYWANPSNVEEGFVTWQVDGSQTHRMWAKAVGPDNGPDGSGIGQRLIPEEPMSIVLNLGISPNWQTIDFSTLIFPAEMLVDYVRVYQRKGAINVGCSPKDYPTADYINAHMDAYTNANHSTWPYAKPKNSLVRIIPLRFTLAILILVLVGRLLTALDNRNTFVS
ncbi:hypothetical protein EYR36_006871 [Pleurotus pulmonarius]|nr:hypothetical protein EYR36_006871 [Pleurotus pulmonarius]KAF4580307.1 hypothetical protein EYR38_003194 [Pleurotus pulmonarius]